MRSSCIVCYVSMSSISMRHDHIKASVSRFRKGRSPLCHQISVVIESSRFRCEVGYPTHTEEWLELHSREAEIPYRERVPSVTAFLSCLKAPSFLSTSAE